MSRGVLGGGGGIDDQYWSRSAKEKKVTVTGCREREGVKVRAKEKGSTALIN